jgi:hypothetical protein
MRVVTLNPVRLALLVTRMTTCSADETVLRTPLLRGLDRLPVRLPESADKDDATVGEHMQCRWIQRVPV